MADYSKYLDQLNAEANNNIYNNLGGVATQLGNSALQYSTQQGADIGETLLTSAIFGLLSGGLNQYGSNQAADQVSLATKILLGGTGGNTDLSPRMNRLAESYRDAIARERALTYQDKLLDAGIDVRKDYMKEQNKLDFIQPTMIRQELAKEALSGTGALPNHESTGDDFSSVPGYSENDPGYAGALTDLGKAQRETVGKFRNDFKSSKPYQNIVAAEPLLTSLIKGLDDPTGARDIEYTYSMFGILEPGGRVTDSEAALARNQQSFTERALLEIQKQLGSKDRNLLSRDTKLEMLRVAADRLKGYREQFDYQLNATANQASYETGLDPLKLRGQISSIPQMIDMETLDKYSGKAAAVDLTAQAKAYALEAQRRGISKEDARVGWNAYKQSLGVTIPTTTVDPVQGNPSFSASPSPSISSAQGGFNSVYPQPGRGGM